MEQKEYACTRCGEDARDRPIMGHYLEGRLLCGPCHVELSGEGAIINCVECGKRKWAHFAEETQKRLIANSTCFKCDHWQALEKKKDGPFSVRVGGRHYQIGEIGIRSGRSNWRGFGGQPFIIEFFDGRRIETNDLWCQGDIPPHFSERLSDNARFGKVA